MLPDLRLLYACFCCCFFGGGQGGMVVERRGGFFFSFSYLCFSLCLCVVIPAKRW